MNKTAVTQLLEELENRLDTINRETTMLREQMIQTILVDMVRYLEIEKQQIVDAYASDRTPCSEDDAIDYYLQTFNPK